MTIDALPAAPSTSSPSTFPALADAFVAALATFQGQVNSSLSALGLPTYARVVDVIDTTGVTTPGAGSYAAGQVFDGVTLTTGMRILRVTNGGAALDGIYDASASGAASRSSDANSSALISSGLLVVVTRGNYKGRLFVHTTAPGFTLGTTALTFSDKTPSNANRLINGEFAVAQRATSTAGVTGGGYSVCDRWNMFQNIATVTVSQDTDVPLGVGFSQKYTVTTTGTASTTGKLLPCQSIEGFNFADLGWGTANAKAITVSGWVKTSVAGSYGIWIRNSAANRYIADAVTLAANTWTYISKTFAGDTSGTWIGATNGIGATVGLALDCGTNLQGTAQTWGASEIESTSAQAHWAATNGATFFMHKMKVEEGICATPFVNDDYAVLFEKCQRYFKSIDFAANTYILMAQAYSTTSCAGGYSFGTPMRTAPTINPPAIGTGSGQIAFTTAAGASTATGSITWSAISKDHCRVVSIESAVYTVGQASVLGMAAGGGNLQLSAEL